MSRARGHFVTRPAQRFNIEARTEKLLSREKPVPAPQFQSDRELLAQIRANNPEIAEAAVKKDDELHNRLRDVSTE